ncbi:uracil-DNA glycosylase [Rhizobium sp. RU36D]|uniref:uracil-DNA glycosylase n=1 Tax=Rhizobium sp. RU36D TaxID=1907415 RepID=UPI0009D90737|nr:uracil-DNA glycosylase [Rhizobium sp. RU36D]SMD11070.1 DNA polymerase [Rhizobium sp. RU36D]
MISAQDLSAAELAALLAFHADAGVEWLLSDLPIDQRAQFAAERQAREALPVAAKAAVQTTSERERPQRAAPPPPRPALPIAAIPDENAVMEARFAAESARTLAELKTAIEAFNGCNLKTSARSTVFSDGNPESGIMVIGPMPSGEDDREGMPFSGRAGQLLDRMLAAIGLSRETTYLTNILPWRPPGDRQPSLPEAAICRPFVERHIELVSPRVVLLLGNYGARFFFGGNETINSLRGQWREIGVGNSTYKALASYHPQDLLAAPATKALAWQDLLTFSGSLNG